MKAKESEGEASSKFTFDPTNKVVGVIDNTSEAEAALLDFRSAGFTPAEVELLTDEEGARRIDVSGQAHEVMVHLFHSTQRVPAFYDAPIIVRRVEEELRQGHHLIGVTAKDADARERVRGILKSHGGHFINFFGRWAAQSLEP